MKGLRVWAGLAISVVCLYLAFRNVDLAATAQSLRSANYWLMLPALAAYFLGVWFRAVRWRCLLQPVKDLPSQRLFPVVVIGYMANNVLPARMGEFVRSYVLGRQEGVSVSSVLATIAVERIFDGIAMLTFMASVAAFVPLPGELRDIAVVAAVVFAGLVGLLTLGAFSSDVGLRWLERLLRLTPPGPRVRTLDLVERFCVGLRALRSARLLGLIYLYSLLAWTAEALMYYVIGLGFALDLPPQAYLLTVAAANLATLVPSSPGYVGPFDAAAIFVLTLFGAGAAVAASYTLALHAALIVPVVLLGFYYLWRDQLTLGEVQRRVGPAVPETRRSVADEAPAESEPEAVSRPR